MKNFLKVFGFEIKSKLRHNYYLITTVVIAIILFLLTFIPRFSPVFEQTSNLNKNINLDIGKMDFSDSKMYIKDAAIDKKYLLALMGLDEGGLATSEQELIDDLQKGNIKRAFVVEDESNFQAYFYDKDFSDNSREDFSAVLEKYSFDKKLISQGVNPTILENNSDISIKSGEKVLNTNMTNAFVFSMIFVVLFDLLILFYGNIMGSSVALERKDRTIEILLSAAKSHSYVFGKLLSVGILGILQYFIFVMVSLFGVYINRAYFPAGIWAFFTEILSFNFVIGSLVFFIMGYLLFLLIYLIFGLKVRKSGDINYVNAFVGLAFILELALIIRTMISGNGFIMKIVSFIPPLSATMMPVRISLGNLKDVEIIIAALVMLVLFITLLVCAVKSYRESATDKID
ncbi:MAG: ABC transporter permease [Finegoldia sp.]|nr:ABC transporter permease [Finegoldia sp.]